jgi:hypothetical protein
MSKEALDFVKHGLALVPIEKGSKAPKAKGWNQPANLVTSAEQARQLNGCNLGLAHLQSGTCALDVDDMPRAAAFLKAAGIDLAPLLADPKAVRVDRGVTDRAKLIFRRPAGVDWLPTLKLADGALELRCANKDGSGTVQDVIHGRHPDGSSYELHGDLAAIPELPKKLLQLWRKPEVPQAQPVAAGSPLSVVMGMRNDYLTSKAGELRHIGMSEAAILGALRGINEAECKPPLAEKELQTIAHSVARYEPAEQEEAPEIVFDDFEDFLALKIPPRKSILDPWLQEQSLVMIHGWRGHGKTNFALSAAIAIATGVPFGLWKVPEAQPVVYIDLEMDSPTMQKRMRAIVASNGRKPASGYFRFYTPDRQPGRILNLASADDQEALGPFLEGAAVVFVDNLSAGFRGLVENDAESAEPMMEFGLAQRRAGRAVVFLHHSNKDGKQRGTSKREDVLDSVLHIEQPNEFKTEKTELLVTFEKARNFWGDESRPVEMSLTPDGSKMVWTASKAHPDIAAVAVKLSKAGKSQTEIAEELGVNQSTIHRHLTRAAKLDGEWTPAPKKKKKKGKGATK